MIDKQPVLRINRNFQRPELTKLEPLRNTPTSFIVDCLGGRGALHHSVKALSEEQCTFVGIALTCYTGPNDNLAALAALKFAQAGDVIVAATDNYTMGAVTGDNVSLMYQNLGVVGMVTDGMVRDKAEVIELNFPLFCAGVSPNSPAKTGPGTVGKAVYLGGIKIESGDVVVADSDGVVIVPQSQLDHVLETLPLLQEKEAAFNQAIKDGMTMPKDIEALLDSDSVIYED